MKNEKITSRSEDFASWYTDVVKAAHLAEYSNVKGFIIFEPNGYAIWEKIQSVMDGMFKELGHQNVYLPVMIPENLLKKEGELVEGFAPEVAWVTSGGSNNLEERLAFRPTSESLFSDYYKNVVKTYRDLPKLYNQWCNVIRWEKETRPFLRSREFLWQEGHTVHATAQEAEAETTKMLGVYKEVSEDVLAMPVIAGRKPEHEKFPGAVDTYCIEAMMQDGKALQAGTSHFLGQNFAKSADIKFVNQNNEQEYAYTTSWGVSTRLIGGVIMSHADDEGMVVPPRIAPYQIIFIPLIKKNDDAAKIMAYIENIQAQLKNKTAFGERLRTKIDSRDKSSVDKVWEWVRKGTPMVCEIGARDIENGGLMVKERIFFGQPEGKKILKTEEFVTSVSERLEFLQNEMFKRAKERLEQNIRTDIKTPEEFAAYFANGNEWIEDDKQGKVAFVRGKWCDDPATEELLKAMKITIRCIPFDQSGTTGKCLLTGKDATLDVIYARSY